MINSNVFAVEEKCFLFGRIYDSTLFLWKNLFNSIPIVSSKFSNRFAASEIPIQQQQQQQQRLLRLLHPSAAAAYHQRQLLRRSQSGTKNTLKLFHVTNGSKTYLDV